MSDATYICDWCMKEFPLPYKAAVHYAAMTTGTDESRTVQHTAKSFAFCCNDHSTKFEARVREELTSLASGVATHEQESGALDDAELAVVKGEE